MMIGAELFRQGPRPKAMAAASVVNWIGTFIIALCFESVAVSHLRRYCLMYRRRSSPDAFSCDSLGQFKRLLRTYLFGGWDRGAL